MFFDSLFKGDISRWNVTSLTKIEGMFEQSVCNIPIWYKKLVTNRKYYPKTKEELIDAIRTEINIEGNNANLNNIDTSAITDMSELFAKVDPYFDTNGLSEFNGDISQWNVSNVTNMSGMFYRSCFNGYISKWDVSNVTNMAFMFWNSQFNKSISKWNVSRVKNMTAMFQGSKFKGDISKWNVSNVTEMSLMFQGSRFNGDISKWNVSKVKIMLCMFQDSKFKGDISGWDVRKVKEMLGMFDNCPCNIPEWYKG